MSPAGLPPSRIAALDVARGLALLAMAAYHLAWDLSSLQLIEADVTTSPAWQIAARLIAGSFLSLVGISLVLAHGRGVQWRPFLRRLGLVGGAALTVTAATAIAVPQGLIFFGILHCIAVGSVLALPFLARPAWVSGLTAALALAVGNLVRHPAFGSAWLLPLGLSPMVPATNDYVPLLPWFGCVLAGVAAARLAALLLRRLAAWTPLARPWRALAFGGGHSLAVYLLHQPLLLSILVPLALALGPSPRAAEAGFRGSFIARCEQTGTAPAACQAVLACTLGRLRGTEAWERLHLGWSEDERLVRDTTLACYAETLPTP